MASCPKWGVVLVGAWPNGELYWFRVVLVGSCPVWGIVLVGSGPIVGSCPG